MKAIVWIVVLGLVAWAGYALLGTESQPVVEAPAPVSVEPMKIGVIAPLTGDKAVYGEPMRNVIALAADEINAAGGVNGRQLVMIYEDDKCEGTTAVNAVQKLVSMDGVKVIIGGFCSSSTLAAIPIVEVGQVALFSPAASSPDLTGKSRFFARNYPSDASQGVVLADVASGVKAWKKVAMIQEQGEYPLGLAKAFEVAFTAAGGTVVKGEFAPNASDFRSVISKLKATKPDALFINTQTATSTDRILKQVKDSKWKIAFIINDAISGSADTMKTYGVFLEGALTAEFAPSGSAKLQALMISYKAKYGVDLPFVSYAQTAYDSVYLVHDALAAVGYDGAKVSDWLKTVAGWDGASGSVTIGPDGDRVGGFTLEVIKDGKPSPLMAVAPVPAVDVAPATSTTPKAQ